jgi:hypothetical protein
MMRVRDYGKQIIWLLLLLLISSCEEPYMPGVINSSERFLVVTGYINSGEGPTTIKLSRTQNLNEDNAQIVETGAKVWVELEEGGRFTLQEASPAPDPGRRKGVCIRPYIDKEDTADRLRELEGRWGRAGCFSKRT